MDLMYHIIAAVSPFALKVIPKSLEIYMCENDRIGVTPLGKNSWKEIPGLTGVMMKNPNRQIHALF